jgi:hypothetical protein
MIMTARAPSSSFMLIPIVVVEKPSPGRRLSQEEAKRLLAKFE